MSVEPDIFAVMENHTELCDTEGIIEPEIINPSKASQEIEEVLQEVKSFDDKNQKAIDSLGSVSALESLAQEIAQSVQIGGTTASNLKLSQIALESIKDHLHIEGTVAAVSSEGDPREQSIAVLESFKEVTSKAWAKVLEILRKSVQWIKRFVAKLLGLRSALAVRSARIAKAIRSVKHGKSADEFDSQLLANRLNIDGDTSIGAIERALHTVGDSIKAYKGFTQAREKAIHKASDNRLYAQQESSEAAFETVLKSVAEAAEQNFSKVQGLRRGTYWISQAWASDDLQGVTSGSLFGNSAIGVAWNNKSAWRGKSIGSNTIIAVYQPAPVGTTVSPALPVLDLHQLTALHRAVEQVIAILGDVTRSIEREQVAREQNINYLSTFKDDAIRPKAGHLRAFITAITKPVGQNLQAYAIYSSNVVLDYIEACLRQYRKE